MASPKMIFIKSPFDNLNNNLLEIEISNPLSFLCEDDKVYKENLFSALYD